MKGLLTPFSFLDLNINSNLITIIMMRLFIIVRITTIITNQNLMCQVKIMVFILDNMYLINVFVPHIYVCIYLIFYSCPTLKLNALDNAPTSYC